MENINWARLRKSLLQEKDIADTPARVEEVLTILQSISDLCGDYSHSRKMILRIARVMLRNPQPQIIAPVCPDYSHEKGKYTFRSLNNGVSLLTENHVAFLKKFSTFLPKAKITFLLADHEADDKDICRIVGKTNQEFVQLVNESLVKTNDMVSSCGWNAMLMTDAIPNLLEREYNISNLISNNSEFDSRIKKESIQRLEMYRRINRDFSDQEILQRTVRTAAQYVAMGEFVAEREYILCNHTTTNLSWYLQTNAAVLHNPVCIY